MCSDLYDGENVKNIFNLYNDTSYGDIFEYIDETKINQLLSLNAVDISTIQTRLSLEKDNVAICSTDRPTSYKRINVKGVSQNGYNWCWATTCAAFINYYKGYSLTAENVANYIFPNNPNQGGTWINMRDAYNNWGLYPHYSTTLSFTTIKTNINANDPLHLILNGHCVGLIGYEDWTGSVSGNDKILILLEPNGGVRRSVTLNSSGNFTYYLSASQVFSWQNTLSF